MSSGQTLLDVLATATRIHVDASVFGLHMAGSDRYVPLTRALLKGASDDMFAASTSTLTIYQLLAEAYRRGEPEVAATASRYLTTLPGLSVVDVTPDIARQAAQVRAQLGGSCERAIQIATALGEGAEVFLTQRSAFRRVAGMRVESLELLSA